VWPKTVAALEAVGADRLAPVDPADDQLVDYFEAQGRRCLGAERARRPAWSALGFTAGPNLHVQNGQNYTRTPPRGSQSRILSVLSRG